MENRQTEKSCLTYFFKLNRDHIKKNLWHFEDNAVSSGGIDHAEKIPKKTPKPQATPDLRSPITKPKTLEQRKPPRNPKAGTYQDGPNTPAWHHQNKQPKKK